MATFDHEFVANKLWLLIAVVTFPLTALAAIAGAGPLIPFVFVTGYFLLVPLFLLFGETMADLLVGPSEDDVADDDTQSDRGETAAARPGEDPLETLKREYASGEIDDAEFERRVERLVALDDVDAGDADLDVLLGDDALSGGGRADRGAGRSNRADQSPSGSGEDVDVEREL